MVKPMTLYEISEKYLEFMNLCEDEIFPEDAMKDTLEAIGGEFEEKADNLACLIKQLIVEVRAIKDEAAKLFKRATAKEKSVEWLKNYLKDQMEAVGKKNIETTRNKISIRRNPAGLELANGFINWARKNADHFLKFKEPMPDKTAIKEALKLDGSLPYAKFIQTERLEIR